MIYVAAGIAGIAVGSVVLLLGSWLERVCARYERRKLSDWCQSKSPEHGYQCDRATHASGFHHRVAQGCEFRWLDDEAVERVVRR